jgi:hypothetical protein
MKIFTLPSAQLCLLVLLFLTLSPRTAICQSDSVAYRYEQFRFPDINRKALDMTADIGGSANGTRLHGEDKFTRTNNFGQTLAGSYRQFVNREKLQANRSIFINPRFNVQSSRSSLPPSITAAKSHSFTPLINIDAENRHYVTTGRYLGWGLNARAGTTSQRAENDLGVNEAKTASYFISIPLTIGFGRIEPIDDIFIAKFMADDMIQNAVLENPFQESQLFELGQIMAHARNQRIFDFRRQRIYELTQLHNWFKNNGVEQTDDILYFTTLTDNWLYSYYNARFSGKRLSLNITPARDYFINRITDNIFITNSLAGEVLYEKQKPLNQYFQLDQQLSLYVRYSEDIRIGGFFQSTTAIGMEAALSAGYFPNSRTRIQGDVSLNPEFLRNNFLGNIIGLPREVIAVTPRINATFDYFLNYRTRLEFRINANYRWSSSSLFDSLIFDLSTTNQSKFAVSSTFRIFYSFF